MKRIFALFLFLALSVLCLPASAEWTALPAFEGRPRLLVTQDGEVDDMNSLMGCLFTISKFQLYAA